MNTYVLIRSFYFFPNWNIWIRIDTWRISTVEKFLVIKTGRFFQIKHLLHKKIMYISYKTVDWLYVSKLQINLIAGNKKIDNW